MVDWYVDKGLQTLINQVKQMYPGIEVGTIGDTAHQGRKSDHNPEADGSVDAADFMIGKGGFGVQQCQAFADRLVAKRDWRIDFIVWNDRIIHSTGTTAWHWQKYSGLDPHFNHLHLSVNDNHENDSSPWDIKDVPRKMIDIAGKLPDLGEGDTHPVIIRIQRIKGITPDGVWGPQTTKAVGAKRITHDLYMVIFGIER